MIAILMMLAPAPLVPRGQTFDCTPVRVWDGDGPLWCAEGPKVRIARIASREMDGTCRSGHPCPAASAKSARDALVALVGTPIGRSAQGHILVRGPRLRCVSDGLGKADRTAAWCTLPDGTDLGNRMLATGTVIPWR